VQIELEPGEPLRGSVSSSEGRKSFVGWIELASVLDAARPPSDLEEVEE
jgi:hypothetical protein